MPKVVHGVFAAVSTPRQPGGRFDADAFRASLTFLLERGIRGVALNGATGEYCVTTPDELRQILAVAQPVLTGSAEWVVGIGSASLRGCLDNAKRAVDGGAKGVLLPMPHFFTYAQDDLIAFGTAVAQHVPIPILLYNLPQFTNGLDPATVQTLMANCPNIVGIKDSSGSLDILHVLTSALPDACRIVGNDSALADALRQHVVDGVISGVAGVLPELILSLYELENQTDSAEFERKEALLVEFIHRINALPTPWGLKIIGESRGIAPASFSLPLSARRMVQKQALQDWFRSWSANSQPVG